MADAGLKRKADAADAIGRRALQNQKVTGRGSLVGWAECPLCEKVSSKRFVLGRGIATHLQAVHQPWNPGKAEHEKQRRLAQRQQAEKRRKGNDSLVIKVDSIDEEVVVETWTPTQQERSK
jgi:hypothetical protein